MLESIHIFGFRRYSDFSIKGFNEINFILGDNNSGKTSLLEAVYTWACGQNILPMINIPLSRARYYGVQNSYWLMEEILAMVSDRYKLPLTMSFEGEYNGKGEKFIHRTF